MYCVHDPLGSFCFMFIESIPNRNYPPTLLLRESYREDGKVKKRTLANLTDWNPDIVEALRLALKGEVLPSQTPTTGPIFGVLFVLIFLANQCGIQKALGDSHEATLALFLILARIAHQGSRLSAVRWAKNHAVHDLLGLLNFDENDLYDALDWLALQQEDIETRLFKDHCKKTGKVPALVLYDVTSSYFEGDENELAQFGYNRDGKKGKKQIVIGLLTADDGDPLAIRVFEGNTSDPTSVTEQINILKNKFGIEEVIMVGDRGMIKAKGKKSLHEEGFRYITALTDAQIRTHLKKKVIQLNLFDEEIVEVRHKDKRLILRRNPSTYQRETYRRQDKIQTLIEKVTQRNKYVKEHPKAKPESGLKNLQNWVKNQKLSSFITLTLDEDIADGDQKPTMVKLSIDEMAMAEASQLDGCYVLETDVESEIMDTKTIHDRYGDLQKVERDFRTLKTDFLEVRPIFLRNGNRTKGHVFVAMLALKITRLFEAKLRATFGTTGTKTDAITVHDALSSLSKINYLYFEAKDYTFTRIVRPDAEITALFDALGLSFPPDKNVASTTFRK